EHEGVHAVPFLEAVNRRDVRVIEGGNELRFALEARLPIRFKSKRSGQNLQRHVAVELGIPRAVDLTHSARAKRRHDFVDAEAYAGGESHRSHYRLSAPTTSPRRPKVITQTRSKKGGGCPPP